MKVHATFKKISVTELRKCRFNSIGLIKPFWRLFTLSSHSSAYKCKVSALFVREPKRVLACCGHFTSLNVCSSYSRLNRSCLESGAARAAKWEHSRVSAEDTTCFRDGVERSVNHKVSPRVPSGSLAGFATRFAHLFYTSATLVSHRLCAYFTLLMMWRLSKANSNRTTESQEYCRLPSLPVCFLAVEGP